jgi:glycosyltransferase involved in cell wall biosynthesis
LQLKIHQMSKKKIVCSLIISTYNWPEALRLVLKSLNNQSIFPDEAIIADDGSGISTKNLVEEEKTKFSFPIKHIWHKDNGFRKAEILNKAIAKSIGNYIIQVDGDCIMHNRFIENHLSFSGKNTYLYGSRVNIQKNHLDLLFYKEQVHFSFFSKGIKKRGRTLYILILANLIKAKNSFSHKFRGCNTSFYKKDFIAVNGYNEDFKGWGREDSELAFRFHNFGLLSKRLKFQGIVYHIFHNEKSKNNLEKNNNIELETIENKRVWTENGINKYL